MSLWSEFIQGKIDEPGSTLQRDSAGGVACYSAVAEEHAALRLGPAITYRPERSILEITGADRASWLHNITTNQVKTLSSGQGHYVFVCNASGRILFDAHVLVRPESIWIDVDRTFVATAMAHFDRYTVMEDVAVEDLGDRFIRLALIGAASQRVLGQHGLSNAGNIPLLESTTIEIGGAAMTLARTDFCGPWAVELLVEADQAPGVWTALTDEGGAMPVGSDAVEIQRIEAGIPRSGREITEAALPGETGQADRAVNTNKGCYIGQEVIERMRSRSVVARRLVGLVMSGKDAPVGGSPVHDAERVVGSVTSACQSIGIGQPIAMAYVKADQVEPGKALRIVSEDVELSATVCSLPFVR